MIKVRIAPSPTGDPHVGTAYVALFNLAFARKHGGKFILRIEDTDRTRSTLESEKMIYESLRWLDIQWDEGPDIGGPNGPYRQSERSDIYREYVRQLVTRGKAYYCFCSPKRLEEIRRKPQPGRPQGGYDGFCRNLPESEVKCRLESGEPSVVRLRVPSEGETQFEDLVRGRVTFQNSLLDDQVLLKSDGFPTYHLANVVDDHLMGITHVMRAEEWISSTPKHLLLYDAFGWEPPRFAHLPLLRNADRSKISKRKNPTSLKWYESQGYLPEALRNFLALLGFSMPDGSDIFDFQKFVEHFDFSRINTTAPVFDLERLNWINGEYIRKLEPDELTRRLEQYLGKFRQENRNLPVPPSERLRATVPLVRERLKKLGDFVDVVGFLFTETLDYDPALLIPKKCTRDQVIGVLRTSATVLSAVSEGLSTAHVKDKPMPLPRSLGGSPIPLLLSEEIMRKEAQDYNMKPADVFMIHRVALTGKTASPPLTETMNVLGSEETYKRIQAALDKLTGVSRKNST